MKKIALAAYFLLSVLFLGTIFETNASQPQIAEDLFGRSMVVWDERVGCHNHIFAQLYDSARNPVGDKILVSDNSDLIWNESPLIVSDKGDFVIIWNGSFHLECSANGWDLLDVYARIYFSSGESGEIFRVSYTDSGTREASAVAIAAAPSGKFVICWKEYDVILIPNGSMTPPYFDLYFQEFSEEGNPLSDFRRVNSSPFSIIGFARPEIPDATMDITDEKIIISYFRRSDKQPEAKSFEWQEGVEPKATIEKKSDSENAFQLTLSPAIPGGKYQLYCCQELFCGNWLKSGGQIKAEGTRLVLTDAGGTVPLSGKTRFYKFELLP